MPCYSCLTAIIFCYKVSRLQKTIIFKRLHRRTMPENNPANSDCSIAVLTRFPDPGYTKTRLIPSLGSRGAARLQHRMTEHVLEQVVSVLPESQVQVFFQGGSKKTMRLLYGLNLQYHAQSPGNLGDKLYMAVRKAFSTGNSRIVLIGADCPGITPQILSRALHLLQTRQMVLGPALDGGYYLLGLRRTLGLSCARKLLTGIDWGTEKVLDQTVQKAGQIGVKPCYLQYLRDIDSPGDLDSPDIPCVKEQNPRISVILPTWNEDTQLGDTLDTINSPDNVEILVADGGSTDRTSHIAEQNGARFIQSPPGRSTQMNSAASFATGSVLLFVHADTRMPFLYEHLLRNIIRWQKVVGGSFAFGLDEYFPGSNLLCLLVNLRSKYLKLPYGDQAMFVLNDVFRSLGGFPDIPILEDLELARRMKRYGKITLLPVKVRTSSRRWKELGLLKTTWIHQKMLLGSLLGFSYHKLKRSYQRAVANKKK